MKKQLLGFCIGLFIALSLAAGAAVWKIPPGITPDTSGAYACSVSCRTSTRHRPRLWPSRQRARTEP